MKLLLMMLYLLGFGISQSHGFEVSVGAQIGDGGEKPATHIEALESGSTYYEVGSFNPWVNPQTWIRVLTDPEQGFVTLTHLAGADAGFSEIYDCNVIDTLAVGACFRAKRYVTGRRGFPLVLLGGQNTIEGQEILISKSQNSNPHYLLVILFREPQRALAMDEIFYKNQ